MFGCLGLWLPQLPGDVAWQSEHWFSLFCYKSTALEERERLDKREGEERRGEEGERGERGA